MTPANRHKPPVAVTVNAMRAPARALALWCQYPIRRKERMLVSSQKNTSWIRLPESAMPSMAPMKASSSEKKRATGSEGEM